MQLVITELVPLLSLDARAFQTHVCDVLARHGMTEGNVTITQALSEIRERSQAQSVRPTREELELAIAAALLMNRQRTDPAAELNPHGG